MIQTILGSVLIAAFFIALVALIARLDGWHVALATLGIAVAATAVLTAGAILLASGIEGL